MEVFFKECKQLLNLGKSQSSNFDGQIADTTVTLIAYILLSLRYRYEHYETMGELYRSINSEVLRETLDKRLWGLFVELLLTVAILLNTDADELMEKMLANPQVANMLSKLLDNNNMEKT